MGRSVDEVSIDGEAAEIAVAFLTVEEEGEAGRRRRHQEEEETQEEHHHRPSLGRRD